VHANVKSVSKEEANAAGQERGVEKVELERRVKEHALEQRVTQHSRDVESFGFDRSRRHDQQPLAEHLGPDPVDTLRRGGDDGRARRGRRGAGSEAE
jgi:hypothetical protein